MSAGLLAVMRVENSVEPTAAQKAGYWVDWLVVWKAEKMVGSMADYWAALRAAS